MALSKDEINFYNDQGYLLVEDVISENQHKEMLTLVDGFFEKSKMIRENDNIFDLEDGHSSENPRLKRIKQPHQHSQFFWDIIRESKIEKILRDLLGDNVSLKTSKLNTKAPGGGAAVPKKTLKGTSKVSPIWQNLGCRAALEQFEYVTFQ